MHNGDIVGFGCAIRDNNGDWQRGCTGTIHVSSVLEGELFAIYKGLLLAWKASFKEVYCDTDCHEAYVLLKDSNIPLCSQENRTANRVADAMAKHATTHGVHYAEWLSPWEDLRELINLDVATS
ncbi:hypothetical protein PIB30_080799 [Stylosanthes scabra]|uniref:RNase H type-1 domain-containing protein n=1 Tax=Stylosanthes scabra TaxID=79078 RepID=A0ABU6RSB4_9FABA|nr:hypothetical protein [Stylosanthes scabra]